MKKLKMVKRIILMLMVVVTICGISTINHATGDVSDLFNDAEKIPTKDDTTQPTPSPSTSPSPSPNNNSTTLPKTGANDTAIWVLAGACAVIAVFTFKKVRDYNI